MMKLRALGLLMALVMSGVAAAEEPFQEGKHYELLPVPVETEASDPGTVGVVEVFSYACIHCKNFDPALETWRQQQPEYVAFSRVPAVFNQTWATLAQAFYTAEALGVLEQVHGPMFRAIHERGLDLRDPTAIAALFQAAANVDPDEFASVFDSFSVRSRVQQAQARGRAYRVTGVPTLIVDGKYRVDGRMAGGNERMLEVVDFLVAREHQAAAPQAPEGVAADAE